MRRVAAGVVLCWAAMAVVAFLTGGRLDDVRKTSGTSMLARDAESARAFDLLAKQGGRVVPALVVYERAGPLTQADRAAVKHHVERFASVSGVVGEVSEPVRSADRHALQVAVLLSGKPGMLISPMVDQLRQIAAADRPSGLNSYVTGAGGAAADYVDSFRHVDTTLLALSLAVVLLVLLAVYRSPILWVIPMLAVVVAYLSAAAALYALARAGLVSVRGATPEVFTVLVFGVATDYALLLVARYREQLRATADQAAALKAALSGGIPTVVASALTVAGGVGCLLVADTNALRSIGAAAAVGIVITMVVMVTFLPALMLLGGRRVFWPATPRPGQTERDRLWRHVAGFVGRRARLSWMASSLLLVLLCVGLATLDASGIPPSALFTTRTDSVAGHEAMRRHFPSSAPVVVLAEAAVSGAVADAVKEVDGVLSAEPRPPARWQAFDVVLDAEPNTESAQRLVTALRAAVHGVAGASALVGGFTTELIDVRDAALDDALLVAPLILLVVGLILVLLLRSLVAPLLLMGTVVLSFAATLGLCSALFSLLGYPVMDASFALYAFVFLIAFGIDYNIFLMARVREEATRLETREATLHALRLTGGVITAAGVVLAAAFFVLTVLPLVPVIQLGLLVAVGVVIDTVVVRSLLVPALAHHIGPVIWWPRRAAP
ncbi:MMPL family transporter [Nonomuraea sp. NPDC046802]|uniref:MMPL family transporter n=1 Tax=Nonomuraea sp. NPDC046802 TaxID=3154919 RepID=UPI0033F4FB2F